MCARGARRGDSSVQSESATNSVVVHMLPHVTFPSRLLVPPTVRVVAAVLARATEVHTGPPLLRGRQDSDRHSCGKRAPAKNETPSP